MKIKEVFDILRIKSENFVMKNIFESDFKILSQIDF
jgi:hypothetical protein